MEALFDQCSNLVKGEYIRQGLQSIASRNNRLKLLIEKKKLPKKGWDDQSIEHFLIDLSAMDSNNFDSNAGVGEREGRIFSSLVRRRHFGLAHGIGRSGDISEVQPKAAGSSLMYVLTRHLVTHALNIAGINSSICSHDNLGLIVPVATGMSLSLTMMALKSVVDGQNSLLASERKYVIFSRIDQKSCFKSIITAGLVPIVVENTVDPLNGSMATNISEIERILEEMSILENTASPDSASTGAREGKRIGNKVLCVLSTTSCFAPRQPDLIDSIAKLCAKYDVGHVINNAYGVQCPQICKQLNRADKVGRVDAIIQSTDKNFMVPVGGAVICSSKKHFISEIASLYPGRASAAPIIDLLITLLSMGEEGFQKLLDDRNRLSSLLQNKMQVLADKYGERVIPSARNSISYALTLSSLDKLVGSQSITSPTILGSQLFYRNVSGCRVIKSSTKYTTVGPHKFLSWGAHADITECSYLTAACAVGGSEEEIELFISRLDKCLHKLLRNSLIAAVEIEVSK